MKKNITINLFGQLYNIDEDAYELLNNYEESLRHHFSKQEDGAEIFNDIEARIAELLSEQKAKGVTVKKLNFQMVNRYLRKLLHRNGSIAIWRTEWWLACWQALPIISVVTVLGGASVSS